MKRALNVNGDGEKEMNGKGLLNGEGLNSNGNGEGVKKLRVGNEKGPEMLSTLKGTRFSSAAPLIARETMDETWHLSNDKLSELLEAGGGSYSSNLNNKTDYCIIGDVRREHTKKVGSDTWTGSRKQIYLEKNKDKVKTLTFDEFMDKFHIRNLVMGACNICSFKPKAGKKKVVVPPGSSRSRGLLYGNVLLWETIPPPLTSTGKHRPCLVREVYPPQQYCIKHIDNQGAFTHPFSCGICASNERQSSCVCGVGTASVQNGGVGVALCSDCCKKSCKCFLHETPQLVNLWKEKEGGRERGYPGYPPPSVSVGSHVHDSIRGSIGAVYDELEEQVPSNGLNFAVEEAILEGGWQLQFDSQEFELYVQIGWIMSLWKLLH